MVWPLPARPTNAVGRITGGERGRGTPAPVTAGILAAAVLVLGGCTSDTGGDAVTPVEEGAGPTAVNPVPSDPDDIATDTAVATAMAVTITSAAWVPAQGVVVSSVVLGRIEDGGSCTLTASSGDVRASVDGEAISDAASTTCGELVVPADEVDSGTWSVELVYTSPDGSASSATDEVEVP